MLEPETLATPNTALQLGALVLALTIQMGPLSEVVGISSVVVAADNRSVLGEVGRMVVCC